jgi:hypothetical protein
MKVVIVCEQRIITHEMLKFNVKNTSTNISKDFLFNYLFHFCSNCVLIV